MVLDHYTIRRVQAGSFVMERGVCWSRGRGNADTAGKLGVVTSYSSSTPSSLPVPLPALCNS